VNAEIEQEALPIHPLAARLGAKSALHAALHGGEDYELLFTAPSSARMPTSLAGVPLTRIGTLKPRRPGQPLMTLLAPGNGPAELKPGGWQHFAKPSRHAKKKAR
jgi:thiamine-monophosphate kinase